MQNQFSRRIAAVGILVLLACGAGQAADASRPVLVPAVKQLRWAETAPVRLNEATTAIVVADQAGTCDLVAADMLARFVARRFRQKWAVVKESDALAAYQTQVLIGRAAPHRRIEAILRDRQLRLDPREEGTDAYAIEVFEDKGITTAVLAGVNGRGVTYAADTFFQLLTTNGGELHLVPASIRDWASIPWRGRPMTDVKHYLEPDVWDCLVMSRMNWIDLRNGTYAFEPDYTFTEQDKTDIASVIADAHKREILVYGAVNVGIPASRYEAAMKKFRDFIGMGVDGLWLSFDDKGAGDQPEQITYDLLQLGREHGMTGNRICITPPKGSYQTVDAAFNRLIVRVPGMEDALWWWTPLPDERMTADAKRIGLRTKPSWWHNWPRCSSGFTSTRSGNLNTDLKQTYVTMPALQAGWHEPSYEMLAGAGQVLQSALPWSGNSVAQEYVAPVFGWWAWSPEQHDWTATRQRAYGIVYGPAEARAMIEFDEKLAEVQAMFLHTERGGEWRPKCPARLRNPGDRRIAVQMLDRCEQLADDVAKSTPSAALFNGDRMLATFVVPMQREVQVGKACATIEFPEYWWNDHQRQLFDRVHADDSAGADALIASVQPRLQADLKQIAAKLDKLSITSAYVDWWKRTGEMTAEAWKKQLAERQKLVESRVWRYSYYTVVVDRLLANLSKVPLGRGRGGAKRQMRILATVTPQVREQFWGDWTAGIHREAGVDTAVFAMEPAGAAREGDFAELPVTVPISGDRSRLGLLIYMNRYAQEKLGLEAVVDRWVGYASVQLLWGDKVIWEGDIGLPRANEWDLVRLPSIPADVKELSLKLRAVNWRDSDGMSGIAFVGPIRLVEMPR